VRMCSIMKPVMIISAVAGAYGGSISDVADSVCTIFENMAGAHQDLTADQMAALFGKFASLFADKIDCSEDPYNPLIGFDLHGVTLGECQAAKTKKMKEHPEIQLQLGEAHCIEKIIDEKDRTAAIWLELGNTGALKGESFKVRGAARYSFDSDNKITSYHMIYDSYHLLHTPTKSEAVTTSAAEKTNMGAAAPAAMACLGLSSFVAAIFVVKRRDQKSYVLLESGA